jgi:diguanylate cyclase (GGDEF)-like protein
VLRLQAENDQLRARLISAERSTARALSRATRLSRVISVLGLLTDVDEVLGRATTEVSELFAADVSLIWLDGHGTGPAGSWGLGPQDSSSELLVPESVLAMTADNVTLAGAAATLPLPQPLHAYGPAHAAWVRLSNREGQLGTLLLVRRADHPFDPGDLLELRAVSTRIALAIDNGRLHHRSQERLQQLQRLYELTSRLAGMLELQEVAGALAAIFSEELPVSGAAVRIDTPGHPSLSAALGPLQNGVAGSAAPSSESLTVPLSLVAPAVGTISVSGWDPANAEARTLLAHLVDLADLVVGKALLFDATRTQAQYDPLTGIANRALLMDRLGHAVDLARRSRSLLALIFIDLDRFKQVNDTLGHGVGDQLLLTVARRIEDAVRSGDTVARLGGDEFVVLCESVTSPDDVTALVGRITNAIHSPCILEGHELTPAASIGAADTVACGYDAATLLERADTAMYLHKAERRTDSPTRAQSGDGGGGGPRSAN